MKYLVSPDGAEFNDDQSKFRVRKMILPRVNKEGKTKVIIEVLHYVYGGSGDYQTTFRRISTDVWINPKNWNKKKSEILKNEPDSELKNNTIEKIYAAVKTYVSSKGIQQPDQTYIENLDLNKLVEFFPNRRENRKSLGDYIDDYISFRKTHRIAKGTLKEFKTLQNRIKAFDEFRGKKTYFESIDLIWSDNFEDFLRNSAKNNEKTGYGEGTIEKSYTILITILNYFYTRRKQLQINLTDDFKIRGTVGSQNGFKRGLKAKNPANPLTKLQLETLYLHKFEKSHHLLTRDRFIWQCYTALRYIDAFMIKKEHIKKGWLIYKPSKTIRYQVEVRQPLNPIAKELLEKYDYDMSRLKITNQAYNRELKSLFKIMQENYPDLNFKNDYGTYCSRDTFISIAVQNKATWKDILNWVGQSSYEIMDRYIKIEDENQEKEVKSIFSKPMTAKNVKVRPKSKKDIK